MTVANYLKRKIENAKKHIDNKRRSEYNVIMDKKTIKTIFALIVLSTVLSFSSCPFFNQNQRTRGLFSEDVINFSDVNSEFDDYNSMFWGSKLNQVLTFSTNRNSNGNNFDIIAKELNITWNQNHEYAQISARDLRENNNEKLISILDIINTPYNELGPYSIPWHLELSQPEFFLFSSNRSGKYNIYFVDIENMIVSDIKFLNSNANNLYPSFFGEGFFFHCWDPWPNIRNIDRFIYSSDKEGNFNIYEIVIPAGMSILEFLKSEENHESVRLNINSSADDKYPFVNGNLLVFSSNRPGGFGGFDLYYSVRENGRWSDPVNFGDRINTPYDERRPITLSMDLINNNLLLFSSNRPGGKGGFDLYYTGINQMIR